MFDDGGHGSHCAGISTGNKIGDVNFNGVAPGAKVIGCKLGNNNYAGGATVTGSMKKCFLYADSISKAVEEPCIINMSFGVGSEIEGRADMELFLDELTKNNPYLYINTSNGNEGPGLSTSGLPAASKAVFASGAVLTTQVGSDMYGASLPRDIILHFSSRGGEVSKPNAVAPGAAASTVPNFSGDRMWGTSMASPYNAGVMSLLLSAAKQEFPDKKIPSQLLYKIISVSADKMEGYDDIDQGGGFVNVISAYELLKKYVNSGELEKFETYTVSSLSPSMPDDTAPNLYLRDGSFITGNETFRFNIRRDNTINQNKFYRVYNLKSSKDWLIPVSKKTHIRNSQPISLEVRFDKEKMKSPGLYSATITGYRDDRSQFPEFDMMATVVIPFEFNETNNFELSWKNEKLDIGQHKRYFLKVPAGASGLKLKFKCEEGEYSNIWYFLHNPEGKKEGMGFVDSKGEDYIKEDFYYDLKPGIYELVVLGYYRSRNISEYDLSVEFNSVDVLSNEPLSQTHNQIELVNNFNKVRTYSNNGKVLGYEKTHFAEINAPEEFEMPFNIKNYEGSKTFEVSLSGEDFNKLTDCALMIYDENGKGIGVGGLSYKNGSVSINNSFNADSTNLTLVIIPAFSNYEGKIFVHINEKTFLKEETGFNVKSERGVNLTLYPSVTETILCEIVTPVTKLPADSKYFGKIYFKGDGDQSEYELPVKFK